MTDDRIRGYTFTLPQAAELRLELDVTSGAGVTAYVMNQADYSGYVAAHNSLFGGTFNHFPVFHAERTPQHRAYGRLGPGAYALVLQEGSEPNLFVPGERFMHGRDGHLIGQRTVFRPRRASSPTRT